MLNGLPYAVALLALSVASWDAFRRLLRERAEDRAVTVRRLKIEFDFEALQRNFLLLDERTKKQIEDFGAQFALLDTGTKKGLENLAASMDLAVKKLEGQLAAGELKANMMTGRRIG